MDQHSYTYTHLEILSKLPTTTLLLPPRSTIVCQIGVGIIVEESRHDAIVRSDISAGIWLVLLFVATMIYCPQIAQSTQSSRQDTVLREPIARARGMAGYTLLYGSYEIAPAPRRMAMGNVQCMLGFPRISILENREEEQ